MKILKKIIGIMVLVLVVAAFTVSAPKAKAFSYVGSCGDDLTYFYWEGNLYIVGTGSMYDYSSSYPAPWHEISYEVYSVEFGYDVESIGDYAFADCGNLSSISGTYSVWTIGSHAFDGCYSLQRMPSYASYIGSYAFRDCSSLYKATVNGGMGTGAFYGCSSLSVVSMSGDTSKIPDNCFRDCYSLYSISIPNSVKSIGESAFEGCSSLHSADVPPGTEEIGPNAFKNCSDLGTFSVPAGLNEVPEGLLSGCKSLQTLTIHDGVTKLGDYSFEKCESLLAVRFPESVKELGEGVFSECKSLSTIMLNHDLKKISDKAFNGCTALKSIELPTDLETLGKESFSGCTAITELELSEGLVSIEDRAFADCTGLRVCVLPTSLRTVGTSVFYGCTSLKQVRYAGYLAKWKKVLVGIDNPLLADNRISADYIDGGNLANGNVWSVSVNGILNIGGDKAMEDFEVGKAPWHGYKDTVTSVTIDGRMPYIGAYAFADLGNLKSAVLPEGITSISDGLFMNCNNLRSVEGTEKVTNVGASAFENCFSLSIDMPIVVTLGDRAFANCGGIESIDLNCEKIGSGAFENCADLKRVIIRNTVQEIGDGAFKGCAIEFADYVGTEDELAVLSTGADNESLTDVIKISYYLKNIYVGAGPGKKTAMAAIGDRTFDIIEIDLDPGPDYSFVGYSMTNDITEAVTDIRLYATTAAHPDVSLDIGDVTYYLLSKPICRNESGESLYLCTTKDVSAGEPIIMIGIRNDDTGKGSFIESDDWKAVESISGGVSSLSGSSKNMRMYYTNNPETDLGQPLGSGALIASIAAIAVTVLGGLAIMLYMRSGRGGADDNSGEKVSFGERIKAIPAKAKGLFKKEKPAKKTGKAGKKSASKSKKQVKKSTKGPVQVRKPNSSRKKKAPKQKSASEDETVEIRDAEKAAAAAAEKSDENAKIPGKHENTGRSRITSLKGRHVNPKSDEKKSEEPEIADQEKTAGEKPKKTFKLPKFKKKTEADVSPEAAEDSVKETADVK
ncbi:MAG: leucine-rich repeat domain-containing protein [Oscillospiraceae bacterium]|nr:leucine-rich repeat domain-containing protein [Oscillospiraceae bacterium]